MGKAAHSSSVDPKTGAVTYQGPLERTPGNHRNMPAPAAARRPFRLLTL